MQTWWDYFNIKKPTFINETITPALLKVLSKTITNYNIVFTSGVQSYPAPMWTNIGNDREIFFDSAFPQLKYNLYHEIGHLKNNHKIDQDALFFTHAEWLADRYVISQALKRNDIETLIDAVNIVVIDRIVCKHYTRKEHFYARELLICDLLRSKTVKKYINLDTVIKQANEWDILCPDPSFLTKEDIKI